MNKKTRSTKSEKWRHTCNSVEIAWTNEQKVAETSYGRNKIHDDEIKKHSRTSPDLQFKEFSLTNRTLDLEWTINGLEKPLKKIRSKNSKSSKNQSEIAACEQKTTSEKANFCSNIVFSLYFKFGAKKSYAAKPLAFSLHFLFRRDQNHYSNLTSKIMKMCEQILKEHSRTSPEMQFNWMKN